MISTFLDETETQTFDTSLLKATGKNVFVSKNVEIRRPKLVRVGNHVAIDSGFYITTAAEISDYVHIAPYTTVIGGKHGLFKIGNFSGLAAGCRIICASDDYLGNGFVGPTIPDKYHAPVINEPVIIEDFVTLGTNVVVMPGIIIGEGSVVGANSLVTKDIKPWSVSVGSPARRIKERPREVMLRYAHELGYR